MSNACTPILVDVASPVLEILLLSNLATFPFRNMDYIVHGSEKLSRLELALAQLYHGYTLQWKKGIKSGILSAMPTLSSV